jgi:hypothetical protein
VLNPQDYDQKWNSRKSYIRCAATLFWVLDDEIELIEETLKEEEKEKVVNGQRQPVVGIKALAGLADAMEHFQEAVFAYNRKADLSSLKNIQFDIVSDAGNGVVRYVIKEDPERGFGLHCLGEV